MTSEPDMGTHDTPPLAAEPPAPPGATEQAPDLTAPPQRDERESPDGTAVNDDAGLVEPPD